MHVFYNSLLNKIVIHTDNTEKYKKKYSKYSITFHHPHPLNAGKGGPTEIKVDTKTRGAFPEWAKQDIIPFQLANVGRHNPTTTTVSQYANRLRWVLVV